MGDTIQNINGSVIATRGGRAVAHGDIIGNRSQYRFADGDFRGAIVTFETTVTQYIGESLTFGHSVRSELKDLIHQLADSLKQTPPEKQSEVETVLDATKQLVSLATQQRPSRPTLIAIASGLKQAAKRMVDVVPKVLAVATQIINIVFNLAL